MKLIICNTNIVMNLEVKVSTFGMMSSICAGCDKIEICKTRNEWKRSGILGDETYSFQYRLKTCKDFKRGRLV